MSISRSLTVCAVGVSSLMMLAGCGASSTASPSPSHHAAAHHAAPSSHATTKTSSSSAASSSATATVPPLGSVTWSETAQADLARQLHHTVYPLDVVSIQPGWGLPTPSVLALEPQAYHGFLYYAIGRPHQPIVWHAVSTDLVNTPLAQAAKYPEPVFWPLHFAWQMETGVQEAEQLGGTLPWNSVTGHVGHPVAWTAYWAPAQSGSPGTLSIYVFLPVYWKDPQDEGILPTALPDGSLVMLQVMNSAHSSTWTLGPDLYKVVPQALPSQYFPGDAQSGNMVLPSSND